MKPTLQHLRELWTPTWSDEHPAVFAAQVRALNVGTRTGLPFGALIALFLIGGLWGSIDAVTLVAWYTALLAVTGLRLMVRSRTPTPVAVDHIQTLRAYRMVAVGVLAAGVVWGSAGLLLFVPDSHEKHLFLALVLAGICSGAAGTVGARLELATSFVALTLAPFMVRLTFDRGMHDSDDPLLIALVAL